MHADPDIDVTEKEIPIEISQEVRATRRLLDAAAWVVVAIWLLCVVLVVGS